MIKETEKQSSAAVMEHPELSLGPFRSAYGGESSYSSSSEAEVNSCKKRKCAWDTIELHLGDPLPCDWEQCLDLQSGRMYYLNRKTLKRSWSRPKEQKLDLELNISTDPNPTVEEKTRYTALEDPKRQSMSIDTMVALPCLKCHLLVMLCRSSPTCPNCKHVHSLLPAPLESASPAKALETLSLLN